MLNLVVALGFRESIYSCKSISAVDFDPRLHIVLINQVSRASCLEPEIRAANDV